MNKIKRVIAILNYVSQAISALTKGAQAVAESWPTDNPFASTSPVVKTDGNGEA